MFADTTIRLNMYTANRKILYASHSFAISFAIIPHMYPVTIKMMNCKLIDFAVLALIFLRRFKGHEQPKQISIAASNNVLIESALIVFLLLFCNS